MADIIPDELLHRLEDIARRENRTPAEVLESLLRDYSVDTISQDEDAPPPGTLARLAYEAERENIHSGVTDTSERSRDILKTEYGEPG